MNSTPPAKGQRPAGPATPGPVRALAGGNRPGFPLAAPPPVIHTTPDIRSQLQLLVVDGGLRFVVAIVILAVGWMLATWAKRGIEAGLARLPVDATLKPLLASLVRYAILVVTLLLVVGQFGVQTTSLIAVLGAAGLAVGLALQGTLSNVASGVMLLVLRPFRVGQFVEIATGRQGTLREIGLFTCLLVTRDGVYVSIPNSAIFGATIVNYTRERTRRVKFTVPVDRANDIDLVEKTIVAALSANALLLKEPAPTAVVQEIQEYAVVMTARGMARSPDYWKALYAAQKDVVMALAAAGVLIPVSRQAAIVRNEQEVAANRPSPSDPAS
jgi:small conductance mechanosensitive channel